MRKGMLIGGMSAVAVALAMIMTSPARAQYGYGGYGPGMMGSGMMGHMMGQGMMGPGMMGPGMMGPGMMGQGCWGPGCGMMGPGMMGPGMMGGYYGQGYGPGMMQGYGPGSGPGMMGPGWYGRQANVNLSTDDVKNYLERWIAVQGNPRLKVGDVKEKDADTIEADVVTKDNSLVQRFIVNRHTGFYQPSGS